MSEVARAQSQLRPVTNIIVAKMVHRRREHSKLKLRLMCHVAAGAAQPPYSNSTVMARSTDSKPKTQTKRKTKDAGSPSSSPPPKPSKRKSRGDEDDASSDVEVTSGTSVKLQFRLWHLTSLAAILGEMTAPMSHLKSQLPPLAPSKKKCLRDNGANIDTIVHIIDHLGKTL
ncbi:hypothetical protein B0H13DRAFT_2284619 [Mycena leptocephala]|nr:hypothetical protein B0H13DRAFT_2284619 [Mycena leptocephala]